MYGTNYSSFRTTTWARRRQPYPIPQPGMANRKDVPRTTERGREEGNHPQFTTSPIAYAHDVYHDAVEEHDINEFLKGEGIYSFSGMRWAVPEFPTSTNDLFGSAYRICSAIIQRFAQSSTPGVERRVVSLRGIRRTELESGTEACELPSFVVQATGPSFQGSANSTPGSTELPGIIGYTSIASFLTVKPESDIGTAADNIGGMEVHARQLFRAQPNRSYVRTLALTEKHARLVHFDCAGSQVTPLIDIHQHPRTLVRLVAGVSSTNERVLGLDDSVQWTILNGMKAQGHVTARSSNGETKTYPIVEQIPIPRYSICSRGTTCWRVRDPETEEEYVIKDSWREDYLSAEHELLEKVKGIPGVVYMASCEVDRGETRDFRCASTLRQYQNRKASRVFLHSYGKSVEHFSSVLQVLYAFRDAIVAHQRLLERGVLHRDISLGNILFGNPDAPEGERGVLIDLDLAFLATDARPSVKSDHTIGTRLFQSISVLYSSQLGELAWEHDYLDDLESFLYSLAFIVLCYRPDGRPIPTDEDGPSIAWSWAEEVPEDACEKKQSFFGMGTVTIRSSRAVETIWGPVCGALFNKFHRWIFQMRTKKGTLTRRGRGSASPLASFHACRDEHYSTVVNMFDEAIEGVRSLEAPLSPPMVPTVSGSEDGPALPPRTSVKGTAHDQLQLSSSSPVERTVPNSIGSPLSPSSPVAHTPAVDARTLVASPTPSTPTVTNCKRRLTDDIHPGAPASKAARFSLGDSHQASTGD
ncbi:hypothetical protein FA13DRAFT_1815909 [Coprinellus micaceus]|uniref:Fungal-type protein kinase domain-containing protein n=1 Tax=Coprinellus micaceus TaxID=71717 RepID=A0A4Y7T2K6_COPMI|nr:hypothetical protein FA13DRAFT_1815909 [Coprinellus micaceus]